MEVEIYLKVDESKVAAYQKLAEDLGDEVCKIQCPRCSQEIAKVLILQEAISEKCNSDKLKTFFSQKANSSTRIIS